MLCTLNTVFWWAEERGIPALSAEMFPSVRPSVCPLFFAFFVIKLRNFFDFLRFRPNLADFIRIASSLHLFDVDFPPFDPKASTFRRGTPAGPPEVPPEGCGSSARLQPRSSPLHTSSLHTSPIHTSRLHTSSLHTSSLHTSCLHTSSFHTSLFTTRLPMQRRPPQHSHGLPNKASHSQCRGGRLSIRMGCQIFRQVTPNAGTSPRAWRARRAHPLGRRVRRRRRRIEFGNGLSHIDKPSAPEAQEDGSWDLALNAPRAVPTYFRSTKPRATPGPLL